MVFWSGEQHTETTVFDSADEAPEVIRFIAARAIAAGEELTINYSAAGGGTTSATDAWFDRMKVKPLK